MARSAEIARIIYKITSDGLFSRDFGLKDQIQSAAVSAMTNIADFLGMARRSAVEVQSLLYVMSLWT